MVRRPPWPRVVVVHPAGERPTQLAAPRATTSLVARAAPTATARFVAAPTGPFRRYRAHASTTARRRRGRGAPIDFRLAVRVLGPALRAPAAGGGCAAAGRGGAPWWAPPDRLDRRGGERARPALHDLGRRRLPRHVITQTTTFAADEFGAGTGRPVATLLAPRAGRRRARSSSLAAARRPARPPPADRASPAAAGCLRHRHRRARRRTSSASASARPSPAGFAGALLAPHRDRVGRGDAGRQPGLRLLSCSPCRQAPRRRHVPVAAPAGRHRRAGRGGSSTSCRCSFLPLVRAVRRHLPESRRFDAPARRGPDRRPRPPLLAARRAPAFLLAVFAAPGEPARQRLPARRAGLLRRPTITLFTMLTATPGGHRHRRRRPARRRPGPAARRRRRHRRRHGAHRRRTFVVAGLAAVGVDHRAERSSPAARRPGARRLPARAVPDVAAGPGRRRHRGASTVAGARHRPARSSAAWSTAGGPTARRSPAWRIGAARSWPCSCSSPSPRPPTARSRTSTPRTATSGARCA